MRGVSVAAGQGRSVGLLFHPAEESEAIADTIVDLVKTRLPKKFAIDPVRDIQVLCPI